MENYYRTFRQAFKFVSVIVITCFLVATLHIENVFAKDNSLQRAISSNVLAKESGRKSSIPSVNGSAQETPPNLESIHQIISFLQVCIGLFVVFVLMVFFKPSTILADPSEFIKPPISTLAAQASYKYPQVDVNAAHNWLLKHINPDTNLAYSFEGVPEDDASYKVTWLHNQAEMIQLRLALGDIQTAERLAKGILNLKRGSNGLGWNNAYMTESGAVSEKIKGYSDAMGTKTNMEIGHAFLNLLEVTQDKELAGNLMLSIRDLTKWLDEYYCKKGEKKAFVIDGENSKAVTVEQNQRVFAFYYLLYNQYSNPTHSNKDVLEKYRNSLNLIALRNRADKIIFWIQKDMWKVDHYQAGYTDHETQEFIPEITDSLPLDHPDYWKRVEWGTPQYLGVIMAHIARLNPNDFARGLPWLLNNHLSRWEIGGKIYEGVPRWLGMRSIWGKGTGELTVALEVLGRSEDAKRFLPALIALQTKNGGFRAAIGDPIEGKWPGNWPYESLEALNPALVAVLKLDGKYIGAIFEFNSRQQILPQAQNVTHEIVTFYSSQSAI